MSRRFTDLLLVVEIENNCRNKLGLNKNLYCYKSLI